MVRLKTTRVASFQFSMAHVIWKSHQGTEKRRGLKRAEHSFRTTTKPAQARAELKNQQRKNEVLAGTELNTAGIRGVSHTTWVHRDTAG